VNFTPGETVPNLAVVPVHYSLGSDGPQIAVFASVDAHVIVDLVGVFDYSRQAEGLRFPPHADAHCRLPDRVRCVGSVGARRDRTGDRARRRGAGRNPWGGAQRNRGRPVHGHLRDGVAGRRLPNVSNLNPARGKTVPNAAYTLLGHANGFQVYNNGGSRRCGH
jgi:hypothetical protein